MSQPAFREVFQALERAEKVLLVAHKKPDGDTLGSSSSVLNWLLREGKDVKIFCADRPPQVFHHIDNIHLYTNDPTVFKAKYDVVIVFDSGDLRYCGVDKYIPNLEPGYLLVNLDHHQTNVFFGDINIVLLDASSTAEVVYRFYEANGIEIDHRMATSLMTGLVTDTSNFSNAATNTLSMSAASDLLASGARFPDILKRIWHDKTVDSLHIWGLVLSRLHHNKTLNVVSTYLLLADAKNVSSDIIEGVSNFLNAVTADADTVLFLRELPNNQIKGSMRSVARDISKVAKLLGGGGHKKAAGFTVNGKIQETPEGPKIVAS
jgi:bifunctional oligoribonuclease and PAP phosphatase NrnA